MNRFSKNIIQSLRNGASNQKRNRMDFRFSRKTAKRGSIHVGGVNSVNAGELIDVNGEFYWKLIWMEALSTLREFPYWAHVYAPIEFIDYQKEVDFCAKNNIKGRYNP